MANNIDIKTIVGKEAITGVETTNKELKKSVELLTKELGLIKNINTELSKTKNSVQLKTALNKQEKINNTIGEKQKKIVTQNTALQKERIRVEQQKKKVLAQTLALEERSSKTLIKGQERLKIARKKAREEAQKDLGVAKKRDSLSKAMTKSILAAGAAMISLNAVAKIAGKILKTVFLGTQDNIDYFNEKLENVKGQFAVLTDSISNFGQTLVETFSEGESVTGDFFKTLAKSNPIYLAFIANLNALKKLFPETAAAMKKNGEDAELLQKMMNELNEKEVEYIGTKAQLTKEMRLGRLESKKAGDDNEKALLFLDKAITAEKSLMKLNMDFAKERSRIANERLELSISTRQDRKEAAILAAAVTEIETTSIKRLTTLETERLTLTRKLGIANKTTITTTEENTDATDDATEALRKLNKEREAFIALSEKLTTEADSILSEFTVKLKTDTEINEEMMLELDNINDQEIINHADKEDVKTQKTKEAEELRKELRQQAFQEIQNIGNLAFDLQQTRLDAELDSLRVNYDARIQAAEGNSELQESLARELAQKQYEIESELFKSQQNQAYLNILVSTAVGAAKALEAGVAGIPLALLVTASGIAQAAIVQSQPAPTPPQFAKGTDSSPSTFIAGEKGSELMITKTGDTMLTPNHATLYDNMEGTQIIPNDKTKQILNTVNMANAGAINTAQMESKLDSINSGIRQLELTTVLDLGRTHEVQHGKNKMSKRLNRFKN